MESKDIEQSPLLVQSSFKETVLPYTLHREYLNLPQNLRIKIDLNQYLFEKLYPKLLSTEISIKYDIISGFFL